MSSRLEAKIDKCLEAAEYYEAHQVYRTIFARFSSSKKFDELLKLLAVGVENMVKAKQATSAIDLAELYADTLLSAKAPPNEETLQTIGKMFSILSARLSENQNPTEDRRAKFISKLISWSQAVAETRRERKRGITALHAQLGSVLQAEGALESARKHFLLADEPEKLAELIVEIQTIEGFKSEVDMFPALVVFQLICLRRVQVAGLFLSEYCRIHPKIATDSQPYPKPLLNYAALLIQAIPKHNISQFTLLFEKYQNEILREPAFRNYIDKIGQMYFGLTSPRNVGPGGLFGNLFKGFMGEAEKKEESESEDEFAAEPMDEDGYDTAPEDGATKSNNQSTTFGSKKGAAKMQHNYDDLD